MNNRILCVDDEPNVLAGFLRTFRGQFNLTMAESGEQALQMIENRAHFAVVLTDMHMPGMSGIQLLARVQEISPRTIRMMLTGDADQRTAIEAVNQGHIFRFLTKPCSNETMAAALQAGLEQHRLVTAEKELLEKTLLGSIKMLIDVLAMTNPTAFGRARRLRYLVGQIARRHRLERFWQLEIAALLSQLGCATVSEEALRRYYEGHTLKPEEREALLVHPETARRLLSRIPRLEFIAELIGQQHRRLYSLTPSREVGSLSIESRILNLVLDYDVLLNSGHSPESAVATLREAKAYPDELLEWLEEAIRNEKDSRAPRTLYVSELAPGMTLLEDLRAKSGLLLLPKNQEITASVCERLRNFAQISGGVQEPVQVLAPKPREAEHAESLVA